MTYTNRPFPLFFIASVLLHATLLLLLNALSPAYRRISDAMFMRVKDDSVVVDVVELPPGEPSKDARKRPVARYADRTSVVEKETVPETRPAGRRMSGQVLIPGSEGVAIRGSESGREAKAGTRQGDGAGEKAAISAPVAKGKDGKDGTAKDFERAPATNGHRRPMLLLPSEQLEELARRYEADAPKAERGKTLQLNTSELRYQSYIIGMKNKIYLYWVYPDAAIRNGWQGKVQIRFSIASDGSLFDTAVVKSSGYPALDDAAVTALKLGAPFAPFPENFGIENLSINGQFEYDLIYQHER